jgi:hypothetical protein
MKRIASGAFCEVFDLGNGTVLKAFRDIVPTGQPHADPTLIPRIVFSRERKAYRALQEHPDLEVFLPLYLGETDPRDYPIESACTFTSACGLLLERIPGKDVKLVDLPVKMFTVAETVIEAMKERVLLGDPWDASGFVPGTRRELTIIDFATPTDELVALDRILAKHGGDVPTELLRSLGLE